VPRAVSRSPFSIRYEQRDSNRRLIESPSRTVPRARRLRKDAVFIKKDRHRLAVHSRLPRSVSRAITLAGRGGEGEGGEAAAGEGAERCGERIRGRRLARTTKRRPLAKLLIELFDCARPTLG
jgi:hypothetical protein